MNSARSLFWRLQKSQHALYCLARHNARSQGRQWARYASDATTGRAERTTAERTIEEVQAYYKRKNRTTAYVSSFRIWMALGLHLLTLRLVTTPLA